MSAPPVARQTRPVRSYGQYCPIARGAEIFATRWTPIIVRNLLLGCRTFGELAAGAPGIPRALLSERLRQLEVHGIVRRRPNPRGRGWLYEPTQACVDLRPVCDALGTWGATWVEIAPEHLDPYMSLWGMRRGIGRLPLPERRGDRPRRAARHGALPAALLAPRPRPRARGLRQAAGLRRGRRRHDRPGLARPLGRSARPRSATGCRRGGSRRRARGTWCARWAAGSSRACGRSRTGAASPPSPAAERVRSARAASAPPAPPPARRASSARSPAAPRPAAPGAPATPRARPGGRPGRRAGARTADRACPACCGSSVQRDLGLGVRVEGERALPAPPPMTGPGGAGAKRRGAGAPSATAPSSVSSAQTSAGVSTTSRGKRTAPSASSSALDRARSARRSPRTARTSRARARGRPVSCALSAARHTSHPAALRARPGRPPDVPSGASRCVKYSRQPPPGSGDDLEPQLGPPPSASASSRGGSSSTTRRSPPGIDGEPVAQLVGLADRAEHLLRRMRQPAHEAQDLHCRRSSQDVAQGSTGTSYQSGMASRWRSSASRCALPQRAVRREPGVDLRERLRVAAGRCGAARRGGRRRGPASRSTFR